MFNADPGLKEENGDTDFKILYQASLGSDTTGGTLIAANKCDKDNRTVVSDKFEQGTTYYICLMAHNGANWAWTATTYSFTYGATEQPTDEPTQAPTEEPTQAPTDEITQAPTGEITPAPTEEPTQSPSEGATEVPSDPGTDTLALSVVAYALVAITGCGALLVIKKK